MPGIIMFIKFRNIHLAKVHDQDLIFSMPVFNDWRCIHQVLYLHLLLEYFWVTIGESKLILSFHCIHLLSFLLNGNIICFSFVASYAGIRWTNDSKWSIFLWKKQAIGTDCTVKEQFFKPFGNRVGAFLSQSRPGNFSQKRYKIATIFKLQYILLMLVLHYNISVF